MTNLGTINIFSVLTRGLLVRASKAINIVELLMLLYFFLSVIVAGSITLVAFIPLTLVVIRGLPGRLNGC